MSEIRLMIEAEDVIQRTLFSGNIDVDSLNPMILTAQTTYLKSFLGLSLYNKIYEGVDNNDLSGVYLTIYDEYVKDILSFQTATLFVDFGGYKVSENGLHKITGDNLQLLSEEEVAKLVLRYSKLTANVEANFKEFVEPLDLPELKSISINVDTDFPWH